MKKCPYKRGGLSWGRPNQFSSTFVFYCASEIWPDKDGWYLVRVAFIRGVASLECQFSSILLSQWIWNMSRKKCWPLVSGLIIGWGLLYLIQWYESVAFVCRLLISALLLISFAWQIKNLFSVLNITIIRMM